MSGCEICNDKGFVRDEHDNVHPCPVCNEDSGYEPGELRGYDEHIVERGDDRVQNLEKKCLRF